MERTFVGPADQPDKYELLEQKSAGGEGRVWRGTLIVDSVHVPVAVKQILPRNDVNRDEWRKRWSRQAEMLHSLQHPRVVQVRELFEGPEPHGWTQADGTTSSLYLVMNWVEGPTLTEWVSRNPTRDVMESIRVVGGLAEAVDYLHSGIATGQPVVHRDIKPSNVVVTEAGPVLVDFGFVRGVDADEPMTVVGSPAYVPPEANDGQYSEASDLYSLGATAYYALTGDSPMPGASNAMRTRMEAVPGLTGRGDLHDHVLSMMSAEAVERPTSAIEWAQALGAMSVVSGPTSLRIVDSVDLADEPTSGRKGKRRLILAAVLLVIGGVAGFAAYTSLKDDGTSVVIAGGDSSDDDSVAATTTIQDQPETPSSSAPVTTASPSTTEAAATTTTVSTTTTTEVVPYEVSDLVGTPVGDLMELATEFGFDVEVSEEVRAGEPGLVLSQTPGEGIDVSSGDTVTVVVSKAAVMPDTAIDGIEKVTQDLEALGAIVTIEQRYDALATPGSFLSQSPDPGAEIPEEVTLVVVSQPPALFIEDLSPVTQDNVGLNATGDISGESYLNSLEFVTARGPRVVPRSAVIEFNLSRDFDVFTGVLGYSDFSHTSGLVRVQIFADSVEIYSADVNLGFEELLQLSVTGVLRLRIEASPLDETNERNSTYIGAARLIAPPDVVQAYEAASGG